MKKKLTKLICKYGTQLCVLAMAIAPYASRYCRTRYYQPQEPEGLEEFMKNSR